MNVSENFSHPRKTCRWAGEEINKFEVNERAFLDAHPGKEWKQIDFRTGEVVHGITFTEKPTEDIERGVYRIVSDLRNALDQTTYAAAKSLGGVKLKRTNFPIGESESDFKARLIADSGNYRDIPADLHPILASFEPYWRDEITNKGDNILRGLAEMANPNKHQIPLGVKVQTGMRFYGGGGGITSLGSIWNGDGKTELYRTIFGMPYKIDMQIKPCIAFGDVGVLSGSNTLAAFRQMEALVGRIINQIEAEVREIIGRR